MYVSLDCETVSLKDKTLLAFSYADASGTHVVPVNMNTTKNVTKEKALEILTNLIKGNKIIMHNSSFDIPVLVKFGVPLELFTDVEDTLVMANLWNENIQHGLKPLTKRIFKHQMREYKAVCGTGKKKISFADVPWNEAKEYAGEDAYWTLKLFYFLRDRLRETPRVLKLYEEIEKPLLRVVADMHINGVTIDVKKVKEIAEECKNQMELLERKLRITMGSVNFNSPKQLVEYFIGTKRLPVIKTSPKTGTPSVDKEVLEQYAEYDNDAKMLLEYRKYSKIYSTFIPALTPDSWDIESWIGKIYTSFHQAGTHSGRFSSSDPNLQNIPAKDEFGIRDCFIADRGNVLVGADFSQIELRVLAHWSQDMNLVKAYQTGEDIHQKTADACGLERRDAKTVNFGLVYQMGTKTLAKKLGVSIDEAEQYMERFFDTYPGIREFWKNAEEKIRTEGYVETLYGRRRRRTPQFHAKDEYDQSKEIRSITNAIIQGTAADIMKIAMRDMFPKLKALGARIVSTVHDEVLVECPEERANQVLEIVKECMINAGRELSVPIEVDAKIGKTWKEVH